MHDYLEGLGSILAIIYFYLIIQSYFSFEIYDIVAKKLGISISIFSILILCEEFSGIWSISILLWGFIAICNLLTYLLYKINFPQK